MSLRCPRCGADTYVYDARYDETRQTFVRRRRCEKCDYRFRTVEKMEAVIKKYKKKRR